MQRKPDVVSARCIPVAARAMPDRQRISSRPVRPTSEDSDHRRTTPNGQVRARGTFHIEQVHDLLRRMLTVAVALLGKVVALFDGIAESAPERLPRPG